MEATCGIKKPDFIYILLISLSGMLKVLHIYSLSVISQETFGFGSA